MGETTTRTWVWRSTEASRAAGLISVLAVAETVVCVALYWFLLLWLGVTWHHWMIVIATPLVLLRSPESMRLACKWFVDFQMSDGQAAPSHYKRIATVAFSVVLASSSGWFFSTTWSLEATGWAPFAAALSSIYLAVQLALALSIALLGPRSYVLLGVLTTPTAAAGAVAAAIAGTAAAAVTVATVAATTAAIAITCLIVAASTGALVPIFVGALLIGGPGLGVAYGLRALTIRLAATAVFVGMGVHQFASNWRNSTMNSDVFHPPALIPGYESTEYGRTWSLSLRDSNGKTRDAVEITMSYFFVPIFYLPTLLWRWSVKSTAWFYLPLLWARRGWLDLEGEELQIWAKAYSAKVQNWAWLILGLVALVGITVTLVSLPAYLELRATLEGAPMTALGVLATLEWSELWRQPWLWFYIPSYVLTILVFVNLDDIAKDIRAGDADPATRADRMAFWAKWANLRSVLTNIGLAVALWYFLDAVDAWGQVRAAIGL